MMYQSQLLPLLISTTIHLLAPMDVSLTPFPAYTSLSLLAKKRKTCGIPAFSPQIQRFLHLQVMGGLSLLVFWFSYIVPCSELRPGHQDPRQWSKGGWIKGQSQFAGPYLCKASWTGKFTYRVCVSLYIYIYFWIGLHICAGASLYTDLWVFGGVEHRLCAAKVETEDGG